jgi:yersiniabactin nonribosomal peptide/polyketide synthase
MLATLASRGMGALSDAEGCWHLEQAVMRGAPWRLAMRVFTDKMPPLQQALFNISATEKAATPVIPPADDNAFNGSLSDETAVMAWLKKRIAVQLRLSDPASLHPNQDLLQLGMDSLLFLELSSDIQHYLGVRINAERAWQDLSPHGLTQLICSKPEATPVTSCLSGINATMSSISPYWRKHGTSSSHATICCVWWLMPTGSSESWRQRRSITSRVTICARFPRKNSASRWKNGGMN